MFCTAREKRQIVFYTLYRVIVRYFWHLRRKCLSWLSLSSIHPVIFYTEYRTLYPLYLASHGSLVLFFHFFPPILHSYTVYAEQDQSVLIRWLIFSKSNKYSAESFWASKIISGFTSWITKEKLPTLPGSVLRRVDSDADRTRVVKDFVIVAPLRKRDTNDKEVRLGRACILAPPSGRRLNYAHLCSCGISTTQWNIYMTLYFWLLMGIS